MVAGAVSKDEMKLHANNHFTRQLLQKQLVALAVDPDVDDWVQFVHKFGDEHTSEARLDDCIVTLRKSRAVVGKRAPGWFVPGSTTQAHGLVVNFLETIVAAYNVKNKRPIPPHVGQRVEFGLDQGGDGYNGKVISYPI